MRQSLIDPNIVIGRQKSSPLDSNDVKICALDDSSRARLLSNQAVDLGEARECNC